LRLAQSMTIGPELQAKASRIPAKIYTNFGEGGELTTSGATLAWDDATPCRPALLTVDTARRYGPAMLDTLAPLTMFALAGTMTPGPNNVMLTASGSTFGFWRTMPHMLGISLGYPAMVALIGLGFGEALTRNPSFHTALKYGGAVYLLYLAWRIAQGGSTSGDNANARPLSFLEAAAFQWVNAKGWMIAVTSIPAFTTPGGSHYYQELAVVVAVYVAIAFPSTVVWCLFGVGIRSLINSPETARVVNLALAGIVAASVVLLFL
jgi:threonine/homoserine/homoserine lactone efflux protein